MSVFTYFVKGRYEDLQNLENDCPTEIARASIVERRAHIMLVQRILPCPNDGCTATRQRQHVEEHVDECEHCDTLQVQNNRV